MSDLALIDTNIFIYAEGNLPAFTEKAKDLLVKATRENNCVVAIQNLVELYAVLTNKKSTTPVYSSEQARQRISRMISAGSFRIILPKPETAERVFELLEKFPARGAEIHDLHLAATMMGNGIETIYTADTKIFLRLGLKAINPLDI